MWRGHTHARSPLGRVAREPGRVAREPGRVAREPRRARARSTNAREQRPCLALGTVRARELGRASREPRSCSHASSAEHARAALGARELHWARARARPWRSAAWGDSFRARFAGALGGRCARARATGNASRPGRRRAPDPRQGGGARIAVAARAAGEQGVEARGRRGAARGPRGGLGRLARRPAHPHPAGPSADAVCAGGKVRGVRESRGEVRLRRVRRSGERGGGVRRLLLSPSRAPRAPRAGR